MKYPRLCRGIRKDRKWSIVYDGSIKCADRNRNEASKLYSVELNSPVLAYEDIPMLQEVVRALRKVGAVTGPEYKCGIHVHISADDFDARSLRNLVNIICKQRRFLMGSITGIFNAFGLLRKGKSEVFIRIE